MSITKIDKMNGYFISILKIVYLNFLWIVFSLLGLLIFGFGPATFAMMKYYDCWFRKKESLPVLKSFWTFYKEKFWQSAFIGIIYLVIWTVLVVNIFCLKIWSLQIVNVLMLLITLISYTHVYTVKAAMNFKTIPRILISSFFIGFGYLHYSIIAWALFIFLYLLASKSLVIAIPLFGIGLFGAVLGLVNKFVFLDILSKKTKEVK